ncbi:DUF5011 domain-containing protein [Listeria ivanovii subsp. londoniensis]|uniref:immunoglobulin-like domain-containing protein n=1 Tax=Listeria ivanovii TaxID=1638 RepID=UPI001907E2D8|nr:immunoglobulin-like domain-containing protein [Listeria ivanovii]MBK2003844.1 DUF5011 domain-containing protein [Listeria ivanovii subsp. londoniensis]
MSKKWKIKQGIRLTSMAFLITGLVISPIHLATTTSQATAATTSKEQNLTSDVAIIALENGDFETPAVPSNRVSQLFNASSVPGWDTTDSSGKIEIQKNGFVPSSKIPAVIAQSGKQWAELNAYENSALYQDVATTPGTKVHWQVYHKGRLGTDVALVEFGEPGGALVEQAKMSDGTTDWGLYKGTYTIPEGQTTTRFQFRAVSSSSGNTGIGNYLDNVQFATASNLQVEGAFSNTSIKVHDSVDYQIQAINNGGMPAANSTFSVQIPAELSYTPGTLSSADTSITSENYDKSTRTLTFTTGNIKKDASINISIPLTAEKETTAATPDTDVVYNDENFEDETTTAEATDSSTKITSNDAPAITGETNTILQPGETFDPIKTITATDKEDGDLTDKVKITNNPVDTSKSGTYEVSYEVTDSDGNTATFIRTVIVTEAPVITGENETRLNPHDAFDDPMSTITATDKEDGDLTDKVKITNNTVDIHTPGSYEVSYEVTDSDGNKTTFKRTVIMTEAPTISGDSEIVLNPNASFDPMSSITANDAEDGNITQNVQITNNSVDTSKPGSYEVTYQVTDSDSNKATFTCTVIVTEAPVITGDNETVLNPNAPFDPMSSITATDKEDGNVTKNIKVVSNTVDTSTPGTYEVAYKVTDIDGNISTFTRTVVVTEPPIINGDSESHINPNAVFDPMNTMEAKDKEDGNITQDIEVLNNPVDASTPGTYEVTYEVTDSDGNKTRFTRTVIVTEAPIITGDSETHLTPKDNFDPMDTITANDKEDGDLTNQVEIISNNVNTNIPGNYQTVYEVTDADGNITTFTRTVVVQIIVQPEIQPSDITNPPINIQPGKTIVTEKTFTPNTVEKISLPKTGDHSQAPNGLAGIGLLAVGVFVLLRGRK